MDPVVLVVVPGFVGGLVIALAVFLLQRRTSRGSSLAIILNKSMRNASAIKVPMTKLREATSRSTIFSHSGLLSRTSFLALIFRHTVFNFKLFF